MSAVKTVSECQHHVKLHIPCFTQTKGVISCGLSNCNCSCLQGLLNHGFLEEAWQHLDFIFLRLWRNLARCANNLCDKIRGEYI